jgi:hypothetical protein
MYNLCKNSQKKKDLGDPDVNAKERSILQNFPFLNKDEVRRIIADNNTIEEKKKPEKFTFDNRNIKENKINNLKSNIFNLPAKEKFNRETRLNTSRDVVNEINKEGCLTDRQFITGPKSFWNSTLDWKNENTEILFRREKEEDDK